MPSSELGEMEVREDVGEIQEDNRFPPIDLPGDSSGRGGIKDGGSALDEKLSGGERVRTAERSKSMDSGNGGSRGGRGKKGKFGGPGGKGSGVRGDDPETANDPDWSINLEREDCKNFDDFENLSNPEPHELVECEVRG